ncbi:MAG: leucyl aminopeptidase [Opitutaceae bacterium]|nr:leucyl aminopeptidase [Cytophagales bacterium]
MRLLHGLPLEAPKEGIILLPKFIPSTLFPDAGELAAINKKFEKDSIALLTNYPSVKVAVKTQIKEDYNSNLEKVRNHASDVFDIFFKENLEFARILDFQKDPEVTLAFLEGLILSHYTFQKYKTEKKESKLTVLEVYSDPLSDLQIKNLLQRCQAVCIARDLVNEPLISLTAVDLAERAKEIGAKKGFSVEIFDKNKIKSLGMGGLLSINAGSPNPPTFSILEYRSRTAKNSKPIILVGKGVVYDTGGLSLKPTPNSMDFMKCDMAGAATVIGTIAALAENKVPVHVIGLIPATENRPDGNAITPGDVVTMHNGSTVEIMNTDAEGRMILADALSYATQYDPCLVIDIATLTGSAVASIGNKGIVYMGTASKDVKEALEEASHYVHERLVEFPLWDEYARYLDSDIADIKNIGGADSGAIVAGKFLEKFVKYPWIHLDIAAMAFMHQKDSYRGKGGTGIGIRLLYRFIKKYSFQ